MSQRISITLGDDLVERLRSIVRAKKAAKFQSSISFEAARILRNQLMNMQAGVDLDNQILGDTDDSSR